MIEIQTLEQVITDEIDWYDLIEDLHKKRCILFLGPSTPVYTNETDKLDFYSIASIHLSKLLNKKNIQFDTSQTDNLLYMSQKFLESKNNVRMRLDDEIGELYSTEISKIMEGADDGLPMLYNNVSKLPWHTIVNTQPDRLLEYAFQIKINFEYYHFKSSAKTSINDLDNNQLLVYNLFGTIVKEDGQYRSDSLVLTEEDQVEFIRNVIRENPKMPTSVMSRFDDNKRYIFLDFNLENWHFRLLMEALKLKKNFLPISPRFSKINFSFYTRSFYKNRYGFVFVEKNSTEFLSELVQRYQQKYPVAINSNLQKFNVFIACHEEDEDNASLLVKHLQPWIRTGVMNIWSKDTSLQPGDRLDKEKQAFEESDCIVIMISVNMLNEPCYSKYVIAACEKAAQKINPVKVIVIITKSCNWEETKLKDLRYILPKDKKAANIIDGVDADEKYKSIAIDLTNILWPK